MLVLRCQLVLWPQVQIYAKKTVNAIEMSGHSDEEYTYAVWLLEQRAHAPSFENTVPKPQSSKENDIVPTNLRAFQLTLTLYY